MSCVVSAWDMSDLKPTVSMSRLDARSTAQDTTVENILSQSLSTPLTPVELRLQSKLAKRSLATSPDDHILKIKTGGQVCQYPNMNTQLITVHVHHNVAPHIHPSATAKSVISKGSEENSAAKVTDFETGSREDQCR